MPEAFSTPNLVALPITSQELGRGGGFFAPPNQNSTIKKPNHYRVKKCSRSFHFKLQLNSNILVKCYPLSFQSRFKFKIRRILKFSAVENEHFLFFPPDAFRNG